MIFSYILVTFLQSVLIAMPLIFMKGSRFRPLVLLIKVTRRWDVNGMVLAKENRIIRRKIRPGFSLPVTDWPGIETHLRTKMSLHCL